MRFFNFFLIHMVQKYQNEIAPIFYYGKSPKTNEKDLKIPTIWPLDWGQPYWMTLYKILKDSTKYSIIDEFIDIDFKLQPELAWGAAVQKEQILAPWSSGAPTESGASVHKDLHSSLVGG